MKELKDALRQFKKQLPGTIAGKVTSVDVDHGVCKVMIDDLEYDQVRLASIVSAENTLYLIPAVDSQVLVSMIEDDANLMYVVSYSSLDRLKMKVQNMEMNLDADLFQVKRDDVGYELDEDGHRLSKGNIGYRLDQDGHQMTKGGENLHDLLLDLITAIRNIKLQAPTGPTAAVLNDPEFALLEPRIQNLLNN